MQIFNSTCYDTTRRGTRRSVLVQFERVECVYCIGVPLHNVIGSSSWVEIGTAVTHMASAVNSRAVLFETACLTLNSTFRE